MITISTRDYSIEQLKHLSAALYAVKCNILESKECLAEHFCSPNCKAYICKIIREREALESISRV